MNWTIKIFPSRMKVSSLIVFFFFESCISVMPTANNSGRTFYESFYVGNGVEKIFVKPLKFKCRPNSFFIDFTLQNNRDTCTANFSVVSPEKLENADSVVISNAQKSIRLVQLEKLYSETTKNEFKIRYTSGLQVNDLLKLFGDFDWNIKYYSNSKTEIFDINKASKKKIEKMKPAICEGFITAHQ